MRPSRILLLSTLFSIILLFPIILNPSLYLKRGNDLQEFFLPLFYYVKNEIFITKTLPLWNSMFLSGVPLLPDPQAPLYYLPNLLLLIVPVELGVIISSIAHITLGGIGMYMVLQHLFNKNSHVSIWGAILYIVSPRTSAFVEAGHWGLIAATAWIPFVVLYTLRSGEKVSIHNALLLAVSLAGVFFTHPTTFILLSSCVGLFLIVKTITSFRENQFSILLKFKNFSYWSFIPLVTFGLVAITLLPQLAWVPDTNRFLLSTDKQVWPVWLSIDEFIKSITNPLLFGQGFANSLDTEKWIPLGISTLVLALYGWIKSSSRKKYLFVLISILILILSLNNLSPFYTILINQNWYVYARVSTRSWFIISILTLYLSLVALELIARKSKLIANLIIVLCLIELLALSWTRITKPITNDRRIATASVINRILEDTDTFRVFCTTRCFSQYDVATHDLETIGGYSTLHQKNYYQHAWQLTGTYWDYYTLALPPIGSYKYSQLDPDFASLGEYNTKYVISPHYLDDPYANLIDEIDGYYIYKNEAFSPRIYYYSIDNIPVAVDFIQESSHKIIVNTDNISTPLTIAIPYTKGWKAFSNTGEEINIQEKPNALMLLDIPDNTNSVTVEYKPVEYQYGKVISVLTVIAIFIFFLKNITIERNV